MGAWRQLFTIEIAHGYFGMSPERCRVAFAPDDGTRDWLDRAGCGLRATDNALQVIFEVSDRGSDGRLTPGASAGPVTLRFDVRARDPHFSLYTDCVPDDRGSPPPADFTHDGRRDLRGPGVSILEPPLAAVASKNLDSLSTATTPVFTFGAATAPASLRPASGMGGMPNFQVAVELAAAPADDTHAPTHTVRLESRSVRWKYLLAGDWPTDGLEVCEASATTAASQGAPPAPFTRSPDTLADGRPATAYLSPGALPLVERSERRILLRDVSEGEPTTLRRLPSANPGNLIREKPADPASLVCEIFVPL